MAGIGFFAPLPLAMMLPFMAGQSMIMGDAFGKAYQYGKRKISAMSNDEFNKLDANKLAQELNADYKAIIPSLQDAIQHSRDFQSTVIQELGQIIKSLPKEVTQLISGTPENQDSTIDFFTQIFKLMNSGGSIIPPAFADSTKNGTPTTSPPDTLGGTEFKSSAGLNYTQLYLKMSKYDTATLKAIRTSKGTEGEIATILYNDRINKLRENANPPAIITNDDPGVMGRNAKNLHNKLIKYFTLYKNAVNTITEHTKLLAQSKQARRYAAVSQLNASIAKAVKAKNLARDIFNVALQQSRNYKDLTPQWGNIKPLT